VTAPVPGALDEILHDLDAEERATASIRIESRRYGKAVTVIDGLEARADLPDILKVLKQRLATGGSAKEGRIELQGDHRKRAAATLASLGIETPTFGEASAEWGNRTVRTYTVPCWTASLNRGRGSRQGHRLVPNLERHDLHRQLVNGWSSVGAYSLAALLSFWHALAGVALVMLMTAYWAFEAFRQHKRTRRALKHNPA
jgi:translation initiation factor 1